MVGKWGFAEEMGGTRSGERCSDPGNHPVWFTGWREMPSLPSARRREPRSGPTSETSTGSPRYGCAGHGGHTPEQPLGGLCAWGRGTTALGWVGSGLQSPNANQLPSKAPSHVNPGPFQSPLSTATPTAGPPAPLQPCFIPLFLPFAP